MTTIVAIEDRGRVHIGSDSQTTRGSSKRAIAGGKITTKGEYTFGLAGLAEMKFRLRRAEWPEIHGDVDEFVVAELLPFFLDTQSKLFEDFGIDENSNNPFEELPTSSILLAVRGRVFEIELERGVTPSRRADGRYTIGSGSRAARGALDATKKSGQQVVLAALEAASKSDIYTSGPFIVKTVR